MDRLPHEALGNRIAELSAHLTACKARLIDLIGEFDASGGWADEGCLTCARWLNWKCGVSAPAAREQVRVARALRGLRRVREAFASGAVSYSKVRALTRVATPQSEEYLLMIAEHGTPTHRRGHCRGPRLLHGRSPRRAGHAHPGRACRPGDRGSDSRCARGQKPERALLHDQAGAMDATHSGGSAQLQAQVQARASLPGVCGQHRWPRVLLQLRTREPRAGAVMGNTTMRATRQRVDPVCDWRRAGAWFF